VLSDVSGSGKNTTEDDSHKGDVRHMGGVAGWWDETSDPGVADALDALAGMSGEEAAQAVEESVEKPVEMVISPDTSGWITSRR
jgi:hypothetical protein